MNIFVWRRSKQSFKIFGYFAIVSVAKKLLHRDRHVGVLAWVYVHFVRWVWHALNKCHCRQHQCMVCTLYRYFCHRFTYLQKHCPQGVHVRPCMRSLFISIGRPGWGVSARLCGALIAGVGRYYSHEESRHICIRICIQSTHVYICARRRDGILACDYLIFSSTYFFVWHRKAQDVNSTTKFRIYMDLSYIHLNHGY